MLDRRPDEMSHQAIGRRIKALRAWVNREAARTSPGEAPLSQAKFAGLAGLRNNTLNQWERGHGRPDLDGAIKLALRWRVTLDWLYFGDAGGLPHYMAGQLAEEVARIKATETGTDPERRKRA